MENNRLCRSFLEKEMEVSGWTEVNMRKNNPHSRAQAVIMGQPFPLSCKPAPFGGISAEGAPPGKKLGAGQRAWPEVQSPQRRTETCFCLLVILTSKTLLELCFTQRMKAFITKILWQRAHNAGFLSVFNNFSNCFMKKLKLLVITSSDPVGEFKKCLNFYSFCKVTEKP